MPASTSIRILETDNNRRGDLFGRLMADLFISLGFEQPRLNVHKSGRELDIVADHRLEPRRAIAECKATAEPIGGDDLNKFIGALDAEHGDKRPVIGYFISLSGFKETALEQERKRTRTKVITLTGTQVVDELIRGRMLIPREKATELAGRLSATHNHLVLDPDTELLAHERGWIWAIYYTQGKSRTHFALIHSDGTSLARSLAEEVIASEPRLSQLTCLNPQPIPANTIGHDLPEALAAWRRYIENECGYIHLDGLPADSEVGSRRLRLENLFVPARLDVPTEALAPARGLPVGTVLASYPRLALLAAPGAGKSTLIKRLAIAYIDPARRQQIADDLPPRDWLPLFFRCRELRNLARGSFADLIEALSQREPIRRHADLFRALVDRELSSGRVLLLVDGLDEISDSGDRAAFVCTLRSALQAYPGVAIVVTSREAGYRHVAAHLASICTSATLSPFDDDDIRRLTVAWYTEVVGDTEKNRTDADQLAATITNNDRIRRLAVNPLLLTTLLLVKRWVGSLPTRRAVLYGKAVEVLLMTWNTEGHEPIADEEALPQLCYVASAMMLKGVQKVSRRQLAAWLREAREALPTELGYVKGTVDEFIHRVEDRSSLLMMTGYDVVESQLAEFFEFRHLTFQEFLTARAMVEGWHPGRPDEDTLAGVLEPHFEKSQWQEVIPLAASLGGKATDALIRSLTDKVALTALVNCLADEAAARPDTIRAAVSCLVQNGRKIELQVFLSTLVQGRYGADFRQEARTSTMSSATLSVDGAGALAFAVYWQTVQKEDLSGYDSAAMQFLELLRSPEQISRVEGALGAMLLCYQLRIPPLHAKLTRRLSQLGDALLPMLFSDPLIDHYSAAWAFVWLGRCGVWQVPAQPNVLERLWILWRSSPEAAVRRMGAWALSTLPLQQRDPEKWLASVQIADARAVVQEEWDRQELDLETATAALVAAWYLHALPDEELAERALKIIKESRQPIETLNTLLKFLGKTPTEP